MPVETILLILVLIAGFYMAWSIGANDVANAMGTSVGSHALSLKKAVIIASLLEFFGAFFFGSHVSDTVQSGIVDPNQFAHTPYLFLFGMLASLFATAVWLQFASYYGWPVSTTHSIVGAIIGFGLIAGGNEAVHWNEVFIIVFSWIISPLFGGAVAFWLFNLLTKQVLYKKEPLKACLRFTPFLVGVMLFIFTIIFIESSLKELSLSAIGVSALLGLVGYFLYKKFQGGKTKKNEELHKQYESIEKRFAQLQVFSACLMAFAHGANDVANSIGPMSACIQVLQTGQILKNSSVPPWLLALGGVGIVIGLATWGWRVIETIGKKLTALTPTRGFSAEFGAAFTILLASRLGLPISTTHTLVGAVIGVGLARGIKAINLSTIKNIILSWVITVPLGAIISIFFYLLLKALIPI